MLDRELVIATRDTIKHLTFAVESVIMLSTVPHTAKNELVKYADLGKRAEAKLNKELEK